jgi:hypothetical protein
MPNPRQGILNGAQELAVCLLQPDLRGGVGFTGSHVDWVRAKLTGGGNRIDQTLASGEFLPLRKEEILVAKQVALVHGSRPVPHDCCECIVPVLKLYSQRGAAAARFSVAASAAVESAGYVGSTEARSPVVICRR